MRFKNHCVIAGAAVMLTPLLISASVQADEVANFYKGKNVSIVVAARAGGGHSNYSLFVGKFWKKHMPGNPTFIIQNLGGAGGTKAANYLYNRSAQDGTSVGILLSDTPFASRMRTTGVKYVADKFHYIGGVDKPQGAFVALKRAGIKTMEDAKKKSIVYASTGKGSQTYILPMSSALGVYITYMF